MLRDTQELIIGAGLIGLLLLVINPLNFFMPTPLVMTVLLAVALLALLFASFIWRERSGDEREAYHRLLASRAGYMSGAVVLLLGMAFQGWSGHVDSWLAGTLGVMVLAKLAAHIYNRGHR